MDSSPYGDVSKTGPSAFYGALSGSVCFPMPLMYNPMNSYPFMSTPFLPVHHPMLSQHGVSLQDSNHLLSSAGDLVGASAGDSLNKSDDLGSRALAFLQSRYQGMSKCFLPTANNRKQMGVAKYCLAPPSLLEMSGGTTPTLFGKDKSGGFLQSGHESDSSVGLTTISPASGTYTEKECYLSSPTTDMEETDNSGKCTAEVVEQKVIPRWSCDPSQPPTCPICGRTISLSDLADHYHVELERLNELMKKKEWLLQEDLLSEQMSTTPGGMDHLRLHSYHDVEKRCPEFRKETYLRVRANRMNRLGVCNTRTKKSTIEEAKHSWKIHRTRQLCTPKQETGCDEGLTNGDISSQPAHQSMLMLELTVQQLAHRAEQRSDVTQDSCGQENRSISMHQSSLLANGDSYHEGLQKPGEGQSLIENSCNGFKSPDMESFQSPRYALGLLRRCNSHSDSKSCAAVDVKCVVCLEPYKKPVVSVCCWHVHCETCWLKSLGSKRLCPQCDTITSPTDLRRIHL